MARNKISMLTWLIQLILADVVHRVISPPVLVMPSQQPVYLSIGEQIIAKPQQTSSCWNWVKDTTGGAADGTGGGRPEGAAWSIAWTDPSLTL